MSAFESAQSGRESSRGLGPDEFETYDEYYRREWQGTNRKPKP